MFEAAGLDPADPPMTLEDVRADGQAIVDSGAAASASRWRAASIRAVGGSSSSGWPGRPVLRQQRERPRWAGDAGVYDTPQTVDLLSQVQSLVTDGLAVYVGDNASGQDQLLKLADPRRRRR